MLDAIERSFYWFSSFLLEGDAIAHAQLRGALDDEIMVTTSDDLISFIEINGSRKLVGGDELRKQIGAVASKLAQVMKSGNGVQHSFGISFRSSPDGSERVLRELVAPGRATAERLGVTKDRQDYFEDQVQALMAKCTEEQVYLCALTHREGLSPAEKKRAMEWRLEAQAKFFKEAKGVRFNDDHSQNPRTPSPMLFPRHRSMIQNLVSALRGDVDANGAGLQVRELDVGEAGNLMRRQQDASNFPTTWRPRFIGDSGAVVGTASKRKGDSANMLPPPLARQMVTERYVEKFGDAEVAKRGEWFYASLVLEIPPEKGGEPFSDLASIIGREIPWGLSFEISPNGASFRQADQMYGGFVGGFGDTNKKIRKAWMELKRLHNSGDYVCAIRAVFTTWAKSERACVDNYSMLKSSLESWGSAVVSNDTGSPALAALCTAAGFAKRSPAPYIPGPISELAAMFPMLRPASVWKSGQLLTHTKEGRPYPVAFGSTLQNFWGTLGFAPSGYGKSFLLMMMNFGILTSAGLDEVPYVVTIDVGPSSRLVFDLYRAMLPERLRPQVASIRIRNDKKYTVNIFDTQHGCDMPTNVDLDFQVSVVSSLSPTLGQEGDRFCAMVIREAYRRFGRKSPEQRVWQRSFESTLHDRLVESGFEFNERTRVWDVVDALFDMRRIDDSVLAQRYAVPRLADLVSAAQSKVLRDQWGTALTPNGEGLIDVFIRSVTSAQSEYELISGFTKFDIGPARAMSIDLEEVVGSMNSEEGRRRSGIMFMLARRLGAKNFFLRWDEIEENVPERYKDYQKDRIEKISAAIKFLEYDEKHYTSGVAGVDNQINVDLRVGRKYKTVTMMFSQLLSDFPRAAVDNCYTYLILGTGSSASTRELQETFSLSPSEVGAIEKECTGPGRMFALFKTTMGNTSQVLHTTAGPFMQWAFSTSTDDALLRKGVTERIGYLEGLRALAKAYPSGSARKAMELFQQRRSDSDTDKRTVPEIFAARLVEELAEAA
jgi:intracellular multiplication protein IcmB